MPKTIGRDLSRHVGLKSDLQPAAGLTAKTNAVCIGLEDGVADILDLVTPATAELLKG